MFTKVKRQEREKQELAVSTQLSDAVLKFSDQGAFLLDGKGRMQPQVSKCLSVMFRRADFTNLTFEKLLAPIVSAKTLTIVRTHIAALISGVESGPLKDIEVRLAIPDGASQTAHYWFDFDPLDAAMENKVWLVRVTDITMQVQTMRELEDLRNRTLAQGEILRGVLQKGGARFGRFLQKTDSAMKSINTVLKKPAREADAFRNKLEETLTEVDRIRREASAFRLTALQDTARIFEEALYELRSRSDLSGGDFLPLAVKLDQMYGQFALVKSLSTAARSTDESNENSQNSQSTQHSPVSEATTRPPEREAKPIAPAPTGSLDHTLQSLTDHVALEQTKQVTLVCNGLQLVPARYQAAIKNVAIQLIRNAVMHGIETPAVRQAGGKPLYGMLHLNFKETAQGYELSFEDDGQGIIPEQVRTIAVERSIVSAEAAARMRDREAIKLIFRSRFTTIGTSASDLTHGSGMSLVRRYIHDAGGKIALASLAGHETRFRITLPPLAAAQPIPTLQLAPAPLAAPVVQVSPSAPTTPSTQADEEPLAPAAQLALLAPAAPESPPNPETQTAPPAAQAASPEVATADPEAQPADPEARPSSEALQVIEPQSEALENVKVA